MTKMCEFTVKPLHIRYVTYSPSVVLHEEDPTDVN